MSFSDGTLRAFVEQIQVVAPELIQLVAPSNDDELEQALLAWIKRAIETMEADKATFKHMKEDGISSMLAFKLSMAGVISVCRENHSNGHVDLTIEIGFGLNQRKRLCEAKIYDGPAYHIAGLKQLLQRYCTGRDKRAIMVTYVKNKGIAILMQGVRQEFDTSHPEQQVGPTLDHPLTWAFTSDHVHSSGEKIRVDHIACNLH